MVLIRGNHLRKTYYIDDNPLHAVLDCNIEIKEGECVVIYGAKGAGKSTLLRLLGGYERPCGGTIFIKGNNITSYNDDQLAIMRRSEVGYLYRNDSLLPELTAHENIILPTLIANKKYDEEYYRELAVLFHINGVLNCYSRQLTQVQQQCVTYVRALLHKPDIILLDEPDHGIYPDFKHEILTYLMDMVFWNQKTLIIATNDPEILEFGTHIIKIRRGAILEDKMIQKML